MKIIKNKKAHNCQALIELRILEFLNNKVDVNDNYHIIRKFDHFYFKNHLCIVFELLNENLYELLKQNYFQGLSLNSIRFILKQILEALLQLQKADLIHCDLKPENILLKIEKEKDNKNEILIKVTDFGSACFKNNTFFSYIQSRYYRAPETIVGFPYSLEIDMWSLGCIAAELYLGEPIFPGSSEFDQLYKIVSFIGCIPNYMLKNGKNTNKYYKLVENENEETVGTTQFKLKTIDDYFSENPNVEKPKYDIPSGLTCLDDIVKFWQQQNSKKNLNLSNISNSGAEILQTSGNNNLNNNSNYSFINNDHHCNLKELESFVHFLKGLLNIDPKKRWNAKTALRHPFILKEKFDGNFHIEQKDEISTFVNYDSIDYNNSSILSEGGNKFYNYSNFNQNEINNHNNLYINNTNTKFYINTNGNTNYNYNISINGNQNFNNNFGLQNINNYINTNQNTINNTIHGTNNKISNFKNQNKMNTNKLNIPCNNIYSYYNKNNFTNNKNCQSMIMSIGMPSSNDTSSINSLGNSFNNQNFNTSVEYSCYQPNICNIPLNMLKQFPYGKIDKIDLKDSKKKQKYNKNNNKKNKKHYNYDDNHIMNKANKNNKQLKYGQSQNQTFTMENFNRLDNHSFTHDNYFNYQNHNSGLNSNNNLLGLQNVKNKYTSSFCDLNNQSANNQIHVLNKSNEIRYAF